MPVTSLARRSGNCPQQFCKDKWTLKHEQAIRPTPRPDDSAWPDLVISGMSC